MGDAREVTGENTQLYVRMNQIMQVLSITLSNLYLALSSQATGMYIKRKSGLREHSRLRLVENQL